MERMLSVVATFRQQGRNVPDYLIACHEAHLLGRPAPSLLPGGGAGNAAA
jgi:hypothetical protein